MDKITNEILGIMIKYNGNDVIRINHVIKVFTFAQYIGIKENCSLKEQSIIEYSSILHDIGIHEAEKKYSSSSGKYQEELGPDVARNLIGHLGISDDIKERVYYLIGNHHSYNKIDGIDFQILVEADFLINIFEDKINNIINIKNKIFKTKTGIGLLEDIYLNTTKEK
jgi:HD superfamily phosphodiesterase